MNNLTNINNILSTEVDNTNRGDGEKILAMCILGLGSFFFGMLPATISDRNQRRFPLTTSLFLCFGAGILLATALVHILPEVRMQMKSNFAEITVCGGFFIIYFIDEFIHYFFRESIQHSHTHSSNSAIPNSSNYGSLNGNTTPLLVDAQNRNHEQRKSHECNNSNDSAEHLHHVPARCGDQNVIEEANAPICHASHDEPCVQSMTGTLGLFVALSLHSAIEGLAIGVQNSAAKVLFLLGAVACHKFVMGFCLGLEFCSNPQTRIRQHIIGILIFALGAVFGIIIGMIIVDVPSHWSVSALPIVQGLAGGTLFYVTVCEVIPREKARWHQNPARKTAGLRQFLAVVSGFGAMCAINYYLDDSES